MARADTLSLKGQQFIDDLPPYYAEDEHVLGTQDALGRELQRVEDAASEVLRQGFPQNADDTYGILAAFEAMVDLPISPLAQTVAARRARVLGKLRRRGVATGLAWEDAVTEQVGSQSWDYQENTPTNYSIRVTLPFASTLGAPTGLVASPSTTGGTLAAGTYYYVVTAINNYGETLKSVEVTATTTGTTSKVSLSWAVVDDATGYRVYRSTSSGTETFLASVTTDAYVDTGGTTSPAVPPSFNTTGSPQASQISELLRKVTPAHLALATTTGSGFIVGRSRVGGDVV